MFLVAAVEARVREIDSAGEVVVEILVVAHRIIFARRVHHFGDAGIVFTRKIDDRLNIISGKPYVERELELLSSFEED